MSISAEPDESEIDFPGPQENSDGEVERRGVAGTGRFSGDLDSQCMSISDEPDDSDSDLPGLQENSESELSGCSCGDASARSESTTSPYESTASFPGSCSHRFPEADCTAKHARRGFL